MAVIHETTMVPGKLELLKAWLPAQPWYLAPGREPVLAKTGGFRLDDPDGEVSIEFMAVTDTSGAEAVTYLVPFTYRGSACPGAAGGLIGTAEHGVLGRRWIYDGTRDQVLAAQLVALIQGRVQAQAQNVSDAPDPAVICQPAASGGLDVTGFPAAASGPDSTDLRISAADATGAPAGDLLLRVHRILRPDDGGAAGSGQRPCVSATWRQPDGTLVRGTFVTARYPA